MPDDADIQFLNSIRYDVVMEFLYLLTFIFWLKAFSDVASDKMNKKKVHERKFWDKYDATLMHEGFFAIATILSFGKLGYYCLQSSRLGPLQVNIHFYKSYFFWFRLATNTDFNKFRCLYYCQNKNADRII